MAHPVLLAGAAIAALALWKRRNAEPAAVVKPGSPTLAPVRQPLTVTAGPEPLGPRPVMLEALPAVSYGAFGRGETTLNGRPASQVPHDLWSGGVHNTPGALQAMASLDTGPAAPRWAGGVPITQPADPQPALPGTARWFATHPENLDGWAK